MHAQADKKLPWVLTDMAAVTAAMSAAFALRFGLMRAGAPVVGLGYHLLWALFFSPVFAGLYALLGVYSDQPEGGALAVLGRALTGNTLGLMLFVDAVFFFKLADLSRWMLLFWWALLDLLTGLRVGISCREARQSAAVGVAVIGGGPAAAEMCRRLGESGGEYVLLGTVGGEPVPGVRKLGELARLGAILRRSGAQRAVVVPGGDLPDPGETLRECERAGAQPYLLPGWHAILGGRA